MKKLMMVLLIAMVGVCFADYKTDFSWSLNNLAQIEKGLTEATAAKDNNMMEIYLTLKLVNGKSPENISYNELKKIFAQNNISMIRLLVLIAFNPNKFGFYPSVLNDGEILKDKKCADYFYTRYSTFSSALQYIDAKKWREKFMNLETLTVVSNAVFYAGKYLNFYKKASIKFTPDEIKADTALMKRAWYDKITISDQWKQLLVQVELMNKSVQ